MLRRSLFLHLRSSRPIRLLKQSHPMSSQSSSSSSSSSSEQPSTAPRNALPAPGHEAEAAATTLDVSGAGTTVKLDALGPLVVNQDGTMSRISNWHQMSDIERNNTLRIIGKRNQLRLAALRQAQGVDAGNESGSTSTGQDGTTTSNSQ